MLTDANPGQTCIGGLLTNHIYVSGTWRGERVDVDADGCSGNPRGEELWLSQFPVVLE